MTATDRDLIESYARDRSEQAFSSLVTRYVDLVYSAALRQVRSRELAEEVTQSVFADLARSAAKLKPDSVLSAWLYQVTRRTAVDVVRQESRRQRREQLAVERFEMKSDSPGWTQLEPLLDEAMAALEETDRTAVLLRFFDRRSLREVGDCLGTSDDAAQKRVSRALERLRDFFAKRGVTIGTASLAALLSSHAVQAAPVGLGAVVIGAAGLAGPAAQTTLQLTKAVAMTTMQKTVVTVAVALGLGTGVYQTRRASDLQERVVALEQGRAELAELRGRLTADVAKVAELEEENARLRRETAELAKLRGQINPLKADSRQLELMQGNDPAVRSALSLSQKETRLRELLAQQPNQSIPELQLLSPQAWVDIAREADLDSETGVRKALSKLRFLGENQFAIMMQAALKKYSDANGGLLPTDLVQLKPFFDPPTDDATLQRYKLARQGKASDVPAGEWVVAQIAPVDADFDSRWHIGPNWFGTAGFKQSQLEEIVQPALAAYKSAHDGRAPNESGALGPYLRTPEQRTAYEQLMALLQSEDPAAQ